ncbi:hypothetical protein GCM10011346_12440 [Oceanobacillus neutriphilus]|uniref:Uncharacterized protein n=1 Tax=Oceanobacillus neutriphilus TaxID=531815 RepID=A0ABQ2NT23_9BACI|nr:hypothetical protein GCM10011346_12440 [Oceanobacillus neutriphilus]
MPDSLERLDCLVYYYLPTHYQYNNIKDSEEADHKIADMLDEDYIETSFKMVFFLCY